MNVAVVFDGVLKSKSGPINDGVDMVKALTEKSKVWILSGDTDKDRIRFFCASQGINNILEITTDSQPGDDHVLLRQVDHLRADGSRLDMVILPDPSLLQPILEKRLTAVVFLPVGTVPPRWMPDDSRGRKTWSQIEEEMDKRVDME